MSSIRRAASIAAIATLVAAGCSSSSTTDAPLRTQEQATTTTARVASATPKDVAIALGTRMLDQAVLPPGAHVSTAPPPAHLKGAQVRPATGNLVFAHRLWTVPGSPDDVQHWLEGHAPRGFVRRGSGSTSGPGYRVVGVEDDLARLPANISSAELQFSIVPSGAGSIVRADTLVGWTAPRPANELVTAKDKVVTVRVVHVFGPSNPSVKTIVTTDPKSVAAIVHAFNALRVSPPHSVHSCPAITTRTVSYLVEFSTARNATPDITANVGNCNGVAVDVRGHQAPNLGEFSPSITAFANAVAHALGLSTPHFN